MKKYIIVAETGSDISRELADQYGIYLVPMHVTFGEEMKDDGTFSPEEVCAYYEKTGKLPKTSGLSGSCNTAKMLSEEPEFEGKVFVVDNGRVSTPLHRSILDALEMVEEGYSAEEIKEMLEASRDQMVIYLGVETLGFLRKGGRITPATAAIGTLLNIKPVLKFDVGILETHRKCRGMKKARREMLEAMKRDFETIFREYYDRGEVYLLAASSADEETTRSWIEEIQAFFPGVEILSDKLSLGLSCHTGVGALGIGCSCRPTRKSNI